MKLFKKFITVGLAMFLILLVQQSVALAQSNYNPPTVLPAEDRDVGGYGDECVGLSTMIRTGDLSLRQIPCFIKFFSQTLIAIAGTLSVIFVMVGGFQYVVGADDMKDAAKRTITYALIGLAVSLMAWILVDIVLQFATE